MKSEVLVFLNIYRAIYRSSPWLVRYGIDDVQMDVVSPKRSVTNRPDDDLLRPVPMLSDHCATVYNLIKTLAQ